MTHRPRRLADLPDLGVDAAARAAGADPEILRRENLDTDVSPRAAVLEATRASVGVDAANSYLPFSGLAELRAAVARGCSARPATPTTPSRTSSSPAAAPKASSTRCWPPSKRATR